MHVREERLRRDIEINGQFGAIEVADGHGRTVITGTDADRQAREYLCDRMDDAGLDVRVDAVGTIVGRWVPPSADPDAAPVAAGSHLDSVPEGGIFDGPLGVYAALEAVRAMQEVDLDLDRPVEVVSFTEEEGQRFGGGLIGSGVAADMMSIEDALAIEDSEGVALGDALSEIGFQGDGRVRADEWDAWLELHVEQHDRLESAHIPAGIVTTISGLTRCDVVISGEADHAGATPMDCRTDALAAASEFVLDVESAVNEVVDEHSSTAVGTVGAFDVSPNAPNVVAGSVELVIDVRDVDHDAMDSIIERAQTSLERLEHERGVDTSLVRPWDRQPTPMTDRCRAALRAAGNRGEIETLDLHSAAGHDTMHVAKVTDAGLLFAPSKGGISHNPLEWTDWSDCAEATQVLAGALAELAGASVS